MSPASVAHPESAGWRRAPWSAHEVAALEARQQAAFLHPYTCPLHPDTPLEVSQRALACPRVDCGYSQDWVHEADTRFRPFVLEL